MEMTKRGKQEVYTAMVATGNMKVGDRVRVRVRVLGFRVRVQEVYTAMVVATGNMKVGGARESGGSLP